MSHRIQVFAIAVENYQKPDIDPVAYAENDAREFVSAWQGIGAAPTCCTTLLSGQATKTGIESALRSFLRKISKEDTVVFFYAGHGFSKNDVSYLTAYDTQPGDIAATSLSLADILQQFRQSASKRVMLFIDACESGLPIGKGMRSLTGNFSTEEMQEFCKDAEHHVGFAACKVDESSWPSSKLRHGIWSYALINALKGEATAALDKRSLVTSDSLRDYLSDEVPRLLRTTRSGPETQTPCFFGNATKQFIVADVSHILAQRAAKANALGSILKDSLLRGEISDSIRRLSGFKKYHKVPDGHFSAAESFIVGIGKEELKSQAESIYQQIRSSFGYKRKDIKFSCDSGAATIKTPDFDVNIKISQDPEEASSYVLTTEVGTIRRPKVIGEDEFSSLFSRYCDTLVIQLSRSMDIEKKIDEIESIPELENSIAYDAECSYFKLTVPSSGIEIYATKYEIMLSLSCRGDIKTLLENMKNAMAALSGSGITLMLA